MNIDVKIDDAEVLRNLGKLSDKMKKATEAGLKDTIVDIANTVIKEHPWKTQTGNNSRSIRYEAKGLTASVYSTSGYGGFLEIGTAVMPAFPYFKPALDRHLPTLGQHIKEHL